MYTLLQAAQQCLDQVITALEDRLQKSRQRASGVLLLDQSGWAGPWTLALWEAQLRQRPDLTVASGRCDPRLAVPFAPFPALLGELLADPSDERLWLAKRYAQMVVSLLPSMARHERLAHSRPFQARLADFALTGDPMGLRDFFQGRNVSPKVVSNLVHFLLDCPPRSEAGQPAPVVLFLQHLDRLDSQALSVLRMLVRTPDASPVFLVGTAPAGLELGPGMDPERWQTVELPGGEGILRAAEESLARLPAEDAALLQAAAVLCHPFAPSALSAWAAAAGIGEPEKILARLADEGLIVRTSRRYHVPAPLAQRVLGSAGSLADEPTSRRRLHGYALDALQADEARIEERVYHSREAGHAEHRSLALTAMRRAWALSSYTVAIQHASDAMSSQSSKPAVDWNKLFGVLHYEAERFADSARYLQAAMESKSDAAERMTVARLLGYCYVFGVRDFDKGLQYLQEVRAFLEAAGNERDARWLDNSIAFALLNRKQFQDALALEQTALAKMRGSEEPDLYLLSLLQFNIARLHRSKSLDEMLRFARSSVTAGEGQLSYYLLLLVYFTLAHTFLGYGRADGAFWYFWRCAEIMQEFDVAAFVDRVFPLVRKLLNQDLGEIPADTLPRDEEAQLGLNFALYRLADVLGATEYGQTFRRSVAVELSRRGLRAQMQRLDALQAPIIEVEREGTAGHADMAAAFAQQRDEVLATLANQVTFTERANLDDVARALGLGKTVGWVALRASPAGLAAMDSLVLFEPRSRASRDRLATELSRPEEAGSALALPSASAHFCDLEPTLVSVLQHSTLKPASRPLFPAIAPVRARTRVLSPMDGALFDLLARVDAVAGVPMAASLGLYVSGESLPETAAQAIKTFLESPVDMLVCGHGLVQKKHAPDAPENFLPLRPVLHGQLVQSPGDSAVYIMMQTRTLKMGAKTYSLLQACNGSNTVADLLRSAGEESRLRSIVDFLLRLRKLQALHFVLPSNALPLMHGEA